MVAAGQHRFGRILRELSLRRPRWNFCAAVDEGGSALTYTSGSWSAPYPIDSDAGILISVSCAKASFCVAGDESGDELTYDGTSWSEPVKIDSGGFRPGSVVCPTPRFCAAVNSNGRVVTYSRTSWSSPLGVDPNGGGLTAVPPDGGLLCSGGRPRLRPHL